MARPKKDNLDYFSHDVGMRNHRKIKALRTKFGAEGYGVRCMLLEHIGSCDFLQAKRNELEIEILSGDFGVSATVTQEIVSFCIRMNLLQLEDEILKSQSLIERMKPLLDKRERERNRVPATESPQSKVKESKGKKKKEKEQEASPPKKTVPRFKPPTTEQIEAYMLEKDLSAELAKKESQKFFLHYESNGRMVGKNKMKKRKSAAGGWIARMSDYGEHQNSTSIMDDSIQALYNKQSASMKKKIDNYAKTKHIEWSSTNHLQSFIDNDLGKSVQGETTQPKAEAMQQTSGETKKTNEMLERYKEEKKKKEAVLKKMS